MKLINGHLKWEFLFFPSIHTRGKSHGNFTNITSTVNVDQTIYELLSRQLIIAEMKGTYPEKKAQTQKGDINCLTAQWLSGNKNYKFGILWNAFSFSFIIIRDFSPIRSWLDTNNCHSITGCGKSSFLHRLKKLQQITITW